MSHFVSKEVSSTDSVTRVQAKIILGLPKHPEIVKERLFGSGTYQMIASYDSDANFTLHSIHPYLPISFGNKNP